MKTIVFIHDSKFYKEKNNVFNNGNLSHEILKRYLKFNNKLIVVGREEKKYLKTKSSGENIEWCLLNNLKTIKGLFFRYKDTRKKISEVIEKADLVIIRLPSLLGRIGYKIAKDKNKKIIIEVVGSSLAGINVNKKFSFNFLKSGLYSLYSNYEMKKILTDAENVIYVTKKFLQEEYPNEKNSISCSDVLIEEINTDRLNKAKESQSNQIRLGMIGFIGNKNKGLDVALRALEQLSGEYKLEVIGEGNQKIWENEIKKRDLEEKIKFLGEQSHDDVLKWLDTIDIYLQPSYSEGLPRSIIEAMSRGCIIIGTNVGGIPELVSEDLIINKGDSKELVKKIQIAKNCLSKYMDYSLNKVEEYQEEKLMKKRTRFIEGILNE